MTIFCQIRNREVADTPEERVRQKLIAWLVRMRGVPLNAIGVEVSLAGLGSGGSGRADIVVKTNSNGRKMGEKWDCWLLAECKAPGLLEIASAAGQMGRYLQGVQPRWLLMTDGDSLHVWENGGSEWREVEELPVWNKSKEQ